MAQFAYSLIALDLDGTLLNDHHKISEKNRECLVKLHRNGVRIAVCTGRSTPCAIPVLAEFPEDFDCELVTFNGACSLSQRNEVKERKTLFYLPAPIVTELIDFAMTKNFVLNVYFGDSIFADCRTDSHRKLCKRYEVLTSCKYEYVNDGYTKFRNFEIPKILILVEEEDLDKVYNEVTAMFSSTSTIVRGNFFVEILNPKVNKGVGLHGLCSSLKIPLDQVVAFGDGDNDIEFLQTAGHSVAMTNGTVNAKFNAKTVSEFSNHDDGVAHELKKLFPSLNLLA